jgi:hypothetical protein
MRGTDKSNNKIRHTQGAFHEACYNILTKYTVRTEALFWTELGKQKRALLQTTGNTPKILGDCKTLLVGKAPHRTGSGYKDLCVN